MSRSAVRVRSSALLFFFNLQVKRVGTVSGRYARLAQLTATVPQPGRPSAVPMNLQVVPVGGQEYDLSEGEELPVFVYPQLLRATLREQAIIPVLPSVAREVADAVCVGEPAVECQGPALGDGVLLGHPDPSVEVETVLHARIVKRHEAQSLFGVDVTKSALPVIFFQQPHVPIHLGEDG